MRPLRRPEHDARVEIMPLIDVIFLLLTFFIYAMVLTVRAEMLPLDMQEFASGQAAEQVPAITISIDRAGAIYVDRQRVTMDDLMTAIEAKRAEDPKSVVYIASDAEGDVDRLPTFLSLYDLLAPAGLDIRLVGAVPEEEEEN